MDTQLSTSSSSAAAMENVALVLSRRGYTMGISLGQGSYSKVRSAYSKQLEMNVAVKIINQNNTSRLMLKKFLPRELSILPSLDHPNVVRTIEIFRASGRVFIVMELGTQGDLLDLIKLRGALPEALARKLFLQLARAMEYLHARDISHRDLKCENLLLTEDFHLKVSDFGFSKRGGAALSETFCGSVAYTAPEVLLAVPYLPKVSDVWSMGVVLYVMLWNAMPFDDSDVQSMVRVQRAGLLTFPEHGDVPAQCRDLIHCALNPDPALRITAPLILQHAWLRADHGGRGQRDRQEAAGPSGPA